MQIAALLRANVSSEASEERSRSKLEQTKAAVGNASRQAIRFTNLELPPLDWSLKTSIRFASQSPFETCARALQSSASCSEGSLINPADGTLCIRQTANASFEPVHTNFIIGLQQETLQSSKLSNKTFQEMSRSASSENSGSSRSPGDLHQHIKPLVCNGTSCHRFSSISTHDTKHTHIYFSEIFECIAATCALNGFVEQAGPSDLQGICRNAEVSVYGDTHIFNPFSSNRRNER